MNHVLDVQRMGTVVAKDTRKLFISVGATVLRRWGACLFEIVEAQVFADCLMSFRSCRVISPGSLGALLVGMRSTGMCP